MTIEELSMIATDEENFSRDGNVVIKTSEGDVYEPKGCHYDKEAQRLVIEL